MPYECHLSVISISELTANVTQRVKEMLYECYLNVI